MAYRPSLDELRASQSALHSEAQTLKGKKRLDARRRAKAISDEFTEITRQIKQREQDDAATNTE